MHFLKVTFLLVLTLGIMRVASWTLGWLSFRLARASQLGSTLIGNIGGLGLFIAFLSWNLMPGEPFDFEATLFGVVVFAIYQALDLKWCLWGARRKKPNA